jgi:hypothetical protein
MSTDPRISDSEGLGIVGQTAVRPPSTAMVAPVM